MMTNLTYHEQKASMIRELARLETIGWGNPKADATIFPYVIIEAINLLINSEPASKVVDFTSTGKDAMAMIAKALNFGLETTAEFDAVLEE